MWLKGLALLTVMPFRGLMLAADQTQQTALSRSLEPLEYGRTGQGIFTPLGQITLWGEPTGNDANDYLARPVESR